MPLPQSQDARLFYRVAAQRFEDAIALRRANRTTGAVYLAGYGLKALVLNSTPKSRQKSQIAAFRGRTGHDFGWLKGEYLSREGGPIPPSVIRSFMWVNSWAVEIRYQPGTISGSDADAFLNSAREVIEWADGRM